MCDMNIPNKLKDKVYNTAIKPATTYRVECWTVCKNERKLHTSEMPTLRWTRGQTRLDHVDLRNETHIYPMAEFLREKKWSRVGHVQRRDKYDATGPAL